MQTRELSLSLLLFSLMLLSTTCISQSCPLKSTLPKQFLLDWKQDTLGSRHLRIRYLHVFRPTYELEDQLRLEGVSKQCIVDCFGEPERVYEKDKRVIYIYFIQASWIDLQTGDYEGMTLEVTLNGGSVSYYNIILT
ncbi:MAG: hypothetical protein AAFP77_17125 [Bacteroidota bacterium]